MSRVSVSDQWLVHGPQRDVRKEVLAFLVEHGMEVIEDADGMIEAKQGSQIRTRLQGALLVNARQLPKRVRIAVRQTEAGVSIRARMEECFGLGVLSRMLKKRYESAFQEWLVEFQLAVA
jgi:hypothetical protein